MTTYSVLVVDDEPDIRELLDITLSRMGLETHSAASLGEAQARISEVVPDLCLTDMKLPDGNGISLVEYIQRDFPEMPVAMITAHGSVETAISALKAGAFDFISKPIELETLRNLVNSALQLEGDTWGLVSAPDGEIHRVMVGSYLGQNNGKIIVIDSSEGVLEIEERYRGVSGRWELRPTEMRSGR